MAGAVTRRRALIGAVVLAALPIWTLPLALISIQGFGWYLGISSAYYTLPQKIFGEALFPLGEFGVIAHGAAGLGIAAALYAALGAALGGLQSLLWPRRQP